MSSDAELLRRFADQQAGEAFTELVQRHIGLVHATALRRVGGDVHLAHDVTQAVFVTLARKAQSLSGHATLPGWLYVCTQHAAAETVRREQRRKQREATAHSMQTADAPSETAADLDQLRPLLDDAILTLKSEEREAVVLRFFAQRTFAEVGAAAGITEEAARKRVDRAVDKLHGVLVKRGFTSTVAALGGALTASGAGAVPAALALQVAGTAVASAAGATGAVVSSWLSTAGAAALIAGGSFVAVTQYRDNEAAAAAIARLEAQQSLIPAQRAENDRIVRDIAAAERAAAVVATAVSSVSVASVAPQPPQLPGQRAAGKEVMVTTDGAVHWDGEPVRLEEFLVMLKAHQVATGGVSRLIVRAEGSKFPQLLWVLEESRKMGIKHLMIESDAAPASSWSANWF